MNEVLIGVGVGGLVSLISAVVLESMRWKREDHQRWDRDKLNAAVDFVGAAQDLVGDQYRRGRAIQEFSAKCGFSHRYPIEESK